MFKIIFDFNLFNNYYYFYERLVILLFSLISTFFLIWFVLYTDRKSKEPAKNIILCLLSGILTIATAGYFEGLVKPYFANNAILIYVYALIEELSKMAIFFLFIFDNKHYDDIYDGLVYMALIALSFAGLENVMYAFSEDTITSSINLSLMRDLTTVPLHVICGIIIGYFVSLGNFSKDKTKRYLNIFYGIIGATLVHGTFNVLMTILGNIKIDYNNSIGVFVFQFLPVLLIMIGLFLIALKLIKLALKLNKTYDSNMPYDKKFSYLMNYEEYLDSYELKKRINISKRTNFIKQKDKKGDDV